LGTYQRKIHIVITERDKFAFKMLEILLKTAHPMAMIDQKDKQYAVNSAYKYADYALKAREKKDPLGDK